MNPKRDATGIVVLLAVICTSAHGQSPLQTTLVVDLQNVVEYQDDNGAPEKFATNSNITSAATFKNFGVVTLIGDIVAVNGQPAKGTYVGRSRGLVTSPAPSPGGAIADVTRTALREHVFEILQSDGTAVGTIMSMGFSGGAAPPGAPSTDRANWAIVGGTGAFLAARGTVAGTGGTGRAASMAEDPANRRIYGGKPLSFIIHVIPMLVPQIVNTANGPAVVHSSGFTLVSASKPAAAGEILSLFATGLGPTLPAVDPGLPFPSNPLAAVNSPVTVTVNGKPADVLAAVGYPGSTEGYQVNFRMPPDAAKGSAIIQVSAAWVAGAPVSIVVQWAFTTQEEGRMRSIKTALAVVVLWCSAAAAQPYLISIYAGGDPPVATQGGYVPLVLQLGGVSTTPAAVWIAVAGNWFREELWKIYPL